RAAGGDGRAGATAGSRARRRLPRPRPRGRRGARGRPRRIATADRSTAVTLAQARRIAVRAQLLDGSAKGVLDTVRRLGFLQMDPISTVAPPQHLVLFSRLGPFDVAELDRLLWEERKLFEYDAFIYPIEDLPLIRARIAHRRRAKTLKRDQWIRDFLRENARFRRYVLRELERNGPLLS